MPSQLFGVQLAVSQHSLTADILRLLQEAEVGLPEDAAAENSESAAAADRMLLQAGQLLLSSLERLAARAADSMGESSVSFAELVAGTSEQGTAEPRSSEAAGLRHQLLARMKVSSCLGCYHVLRATACSRPVDACPCAADVHAHAA